MMTQSFCAYNAFLRLERSPGFAGVLQIFPGYCFARFRYADRLRVLKALGVVDLVGMNGQPEPIPEAEIDAVRSLVGSSLRYDPHPFLTEGMAVEVVRS